MLAAAPARGLLLVSFASANISAAGITVEVLSDFPFDDTPIQLRMTADESAFVDVRIPVWAVGASVRTTPCDAREPASSASAGAAQALRNGTEHRFALAAGAELCASLLLPMSVRIEPRLHGAVAIHRGPLLYAIPLNFSASVVVTSTLFE